MKLADWLKANGIRRYKFAQMIGRSPPYVTQLCKDDYYPSRETAERIRNVTGGAVTPNDWLPPMETEPAE